MSMDDEDPLTALRGFIPDAAAEAIRRLDGRLTAMKSLGLSEEEGIERGMIPGLALKHFEASALKLRALHTLGIPVEQGLRTGLVQEDNIETCFSFLTLFETLETLSITYEEGVELGYVDDGLRTGELAKSPFAVKPLVESSSSSPASTMPVSSSRSRCRAVSDEFRRESSPCDESHAASDFVEWQWLQSDVISSDRSDEVVAEGGAPLHATCCGIGGMRVHSVHSVQPVHPGYRRPHGVPFSAKVVSL
jgi:hypothetical protein